MVKESAMQEARDGLVVYTKDRPFSLSRIADVTFRLLSDSKIPQSQYVRSRLGHGLLDSRCPVLSSLVHDEMFIISTGRMALPVNSHKNAVWSSAPSPDQVLPPVSATPSPLGGSFTWTHLRTSERPFTGHAEHKHLLYLVFQMPASAEGPWET